MLGVAFGNSDFQAAVKRAVKKGEVFKAYPTCFAHIDTLQMRAALERSKSARDIVLNNVAGARLAVRVKLYPYPEGTAVVWMMIAVCFPSLDPL